MLREEATRWGERVSCLDRAVGVGFMEEVVAWSLEISVRFTETGCPRVGDTNATLSYTVPQLVPLSLEPSLVPRSWRQIPCFPAS